LHGELNEQDQGFKNHLADSYSRMSGWSMLFAWMARLVAKNGRRLNPNPALNHAPFPPAD